MRFLLLASAAVSIGCATYVPRPLEPQGELDAIRRAPDLNVVVYRSAGFATESQPATAFDVNDGLDESESVAVALTFNRELRAKRLEMGEPRALLVAAGLWPNPVLGVSAQDGIAGAPGWTADGSLLFALLRPGERSAKIGAARARILKVAAEIVAEEWKVVAETRRRRFHVLAAKQRQTLLQDEVALRERALGLTLRRREVGEGTVLDEEVSRLELADSMRELRAARADVEAATKSLTQVMGLPPDYPLSLSGSSEPLRFVVYPALAEDEIDRRLLAGRFELRAAEAAYTEAEAELRLEFERQYPGVSLGPTYGREPEGTNYVGLGVSVEIPLFDRNQGPIGVACARRDEARGRYVSLLHGLLSEAHTARAKLRRAQEELEIQERDVLPVLARSRSLFDQAFERREIGVFEWVTAQQRSLRIRQSYLAALIAYQEAVIELETTTGMPLSSRPAGDQ